MTTVEPPSDGVSVNLPVPERALAIGAHPDDVEFGCGGTLAKWAAAGCEVHHLVLTDGSKGTWNPDEDIPRLIVIRQAEQRAASEALGGRGRVTFLDGVDGELEAGMAQRAQVAHVIRTVRPHVVLGHDPWKRYRLHPDHRNAGFLATDGIVAARDPFFFPEQDAAPWRPDHLLLWEADEPDHVEDVEGHEDVRLAALLEHRSQFRSTMRIDDPDAADAVAGFRTLMLERLAAHAAVAHDTAPEIRLAESFKRMSHL